MLMQKTKVIPKQSLSLTSFFGPGDIVVHVEGLPRNAAIQRLIDHVADHHNLQDPIAIYNAVVERENANNTVVGPGLAIPHARIDSINMPYIGVATSQKGIPFEKDLPPVHLILLVLIPRNQPGLYLQVLRAIAGIMRDKAAAKSVAALQTPDEVMKFFERGGLVLPDYVCAADIMYTKYVSLKNNDSLKTAIDCFIETKQDEIPVLDRDGDMVGIVSASALLKVCLPEYLLWMSDLSPIVNFEPFANVLRNEQNTSLSDILQEDFASVQMKAPAISVAGELTRGNAARCYVLSDKKLMGIIDFPTFLNKIFRE